MEPEDDEKETFHQFAARRRREKAQVGAARALAHRDYGHSIRNDGSLDLRHPSDLAGYRPQRSSRSQSISDPGGHPPGANAIPEPILQADAAIRAVANAATFGGADKFASAMDALSGGLNGWRQRYEDNLQQEHARTQYDGANRHFAQSAGSVGGAVLGIAALGPQEGAAAAAPRLAGAAKLTGKEIGGILGLGGGVGGASLALQDAITHRASSPGDFVGAIMGGVAGAAALPLGPARAGAVAGAATSVAQDLLNGRSVSAAQAAQSALTGDILGGLGGSIGRKWSNSLSSAKKGHLGEALGPLRNEINGQGRGHTTARAPVKSGQTGPLKRKGSYWKPDGLGGPPPVKPGEEWPDMFEDKFGYQADLSKNQKIAQENWGPRFHLNHFLPDDIGLMTGVPAATFGAQGFNRAWKR